MGQYKIIVPRAGRNYLTNPSFETITGGVPTGWASSGTGGALSMVTTPRMDGLNAVQIFGGTRYLAQTIPATGLTAGAVYRASVWAFLGAGSGAYLIVQNFDGSSSISTNVTGLGIWKRYEVSFTAGTQSIQFILQVSDVSSIATFDCAQFELMDTGNLLLNPGFEQASAGAPNNWTGTGVTQQTSGTGQTHNGSAGSAYMSAAGSNFSQTVTGLTVGETVTIGCWMLGTGVVTLSSTDTTGQNTYSTSTTLAIQGAVNGQSYPWVYVSLQRPIFNGQCTLTVTLPNANSAVNVDDCTVNYLYSFASESATTYIDGNQPDCLWVDGTAGSQSTRSNQTRAGGAILDFNKYGIAITGTKGTGMAPVNAVLVPNSMINGATYQRSTYKERAVDLRMNQTSKSQTDYHKKMRAFGLALGLDATNITQTALLRYTGGTREIDLPVVLTASPIGDRTSAVFNEKPQITLTSPSVFWTNATGNGGTSIYSSNNLTPHGALERVNGSWDNMAGGVAATTLSNTTVNAIVQDGRGAAYMVGNFATANGATVNNVVKWYQPTGTYTGYGTGASGPLYTCALDPAGQYLYCAGLCATANGVTVNNIFRILLSSGAYSALGTTTVGTVGRVNGIAFDATGLLWVVGAMTSAGGVACSGVAVYDPVANSWATGGAGAAVGGSTTINAIALLPNNSFAVGGSFSILNGVACSCIAYLNPTTKAASIIGQSGNQGLYNSFTGTPTCNSILAIPNGDIYFGGSFDYAGASGGVAAMNVTRFANGSSYVGLGSGLGTASGGGTGDNTFTLALDPAWNVYAGGFYTSNGYNLALWDGFQWRQSDLSLPAAASTVQTISYSTYGGGLLMVGGNLTQATTALGYSTTFTPPATVRVYPTITFTGPGTLVSLRNNATGALINFNNLVMSPGDILTLTLSPQKRAFTSAFRGNIYSTISTGSNLLDFYIAPGQNSISAYITGAGFGTSATMQWRDQFLDIHGAVSP